MNTFQPDQRLHSPGEFSAVLKRRGRIRGSCFELQHAPTGVPKARLGLVIAKRYAKQSVLRNLIKRQVREVFRHQAAHLPDEDFVVRLIKPMQGLPETRSEQRRWVRQEVTNLFFQMSPMTTQA